MVGIVIVSHSARLAEGVAELAREMGGTDVTIEVAGGLDEPGRPLGTDAAAVAQAIGSAASGDGVLVLMDLGSAVLSAETALDMLGDEQSDEILLCSAPLVEGAVAAAVAARQGSSLAQVAEEARRGLAMKASHLDEDPSEPEAEAAPDGAGSEDAEELRLLVDNPMGLHARPAARFVQTAARFDADVSIVNATTRRGPASARSLSGVATLGVRRGHEILVRARGAEAREALDALQRLADERFGETEPASPSSSPSTKASEAAGASGSEDEVEGDECVLSGIAVSPGIAIGEAMVWRPRAPVVPEAAAGEAGAEWSALQEALARARDELDATRASVADRLGHHEAAIFDAQKLLLDDDALLAPARRAIFEDGMTAARAFSDAAEATARAYRELDDEYQRARAADVEDVARNVLLGLLDDPGEPLSPDREVVVLATDLTPAETAALDPKLVLAIATARGGPGSHSSILARSAGIPAVVGVGPRLLAVEDGTTVAVDGASGTVHVDPAPAALDDLEARFRKEEKAASEARAAAQGPALTRDDVHVGVMANAGSVADVAAAAAHGAEGIGLLRTEFVFMGRDEMPDEDEQLSVYAAAAAALEGRPLVLRTLDAGADKPLEYLAQPAEDNPFLGVRGVRLGLDQPDLLVPQLRAALRAAARHPLKIMFPMVATVEELEGALSLLDAARDDLERAGAEVPRPEVGVMIEVPAAALLADRLAAHVDFLSIGTNDLAQYTMAAERGNDRVASLADALHPAVLRLIAMTCDAAGAQGRQVAVCGELGGDASATAILVGLGVKELSMGAPAIAAVKGAIREIEVPAARRLAQAALALDTAAEVRSMILEDGGQSEART